MKALLLRLAELPDKAWLALAFLLRLGFALKLGGGFYQADEQGFELPAWGIIHQGLYGWDGYALIQPPLASALIALVYAVCGRHPLAARLFLTVVGTATAYLVGRFVRDLTGSSKSGKLALMLACVYPFFIYYGGMLTSETSYLLASTAGLWLLCRSLRERGAPLWEAAAAGLTLSLAGLCRTEGAAIFLIILLCSLAAVAAGRWDGRSALAALFFFAAPLAGWTARNHAHSGHWSFDEHGGTSLLHGTVVFDENEVDTSVAMDALHGMKFWNDGWAMPEHEREKYFTQVAFQYMREHPAKTLGQWARKFVSFWRFYPRVDKSYRGIPGNDPGAGVSRWLMVLASLLFEPALILGGLYGLWTLRERAWELFPLGLFILGTNAVHVLSVSQMRYRLPIMPVLMLGLCFLLSHLVDEPVA
ncbi:MAG: glycosyltransferase family 39 protein [Elusimicrobia bacterium]|nr:glycosyltransferase family 39 protein [Elusimicrobiota bacterium]